MARQRSFKSGFWLDPDVMSMSLEGVVFFMGTWNQADRIGLLEDRPRHIMARIRPQLMERANEIAAEVVNSGLLVRYVASDGTKMLKVRNFSKHQKFHRDEQRDPNLLDVGELKGGAQEVLAGPVAPFHLSSFKNIAADAAESAPKKEKDAHPLFVPMRDRLVRAYEETRKTKYPFGGAKDAQAVNSILKLTSNPEEAAHRFVQGLTHSDKFYRIHTIAQLAMSKNWAAYDVPSGAEIVATLTFEELCRRATCTGMKGRVRWYMAPRGVYLAPYDGSVPDVV